MLDHFDTIDFSLFSLTARNTNCKEMKLPGIFINVLMFLIVYTLTKDKRQHHLNFSLTSEKNAW
jgi:hypothetical protein